MENLKSQKERPIFYQMVLSFISYHFKDKLIKENILYSSPETISDVKSENCDIWACGIIMFLLLSGEYPFNGENIEEIKSKIISGKFVFDFDKFIGVSEEAKDLIKKCLKIKIFLNYIYYFLLCILN